MFQNYLFPAFFATFLLTIPAQNPPKVPQIFLPQPQPTSPQPQSSDMPLSLKALQSVIPKSSKSSNCYDTLSNIIEILAARDLEKNKQKKNGVYDFTDEKNIYIDTTSKAINEILDRNYQYQKIGSNIYTNRYVGQGTTPYYPAQYVQPRYQYANVLPSNQPMNPVVKYVGGQSMAAGPTWEVIPITKLNGYIDDKDTIAVFYKPKLVSAYGRNSLSQQTKKVLVPYSVSKLR